MSRYPFPTVPIGWYRVALAADLGRRGVLPLRVFGRDLVLWRSNDGHAVAQDAHCPHQGAHLGYGGVVAGEGIRCPFHGWVLNQEGVAVRALGCKKPPRSEPLGTWPLLEQDGDLFVFFHPNGEAPTWTPSPLPEASDPGFTVVEDRVWMFKSHIQEVIENQVDAAHFPALHRTPGMPAITFQTDGHRASLLNQVAMASLEGEKSTTLTSEGEGLGLWQLRFEGIVSTIVTTQCTPIDDETVAFRLVFRAEDSDAGRAFAKSVRLQLKQDDKVWEHKVYRENPPLTEADGPVMAYRKWAATFYK